MRILKNVLKKLVPKSVLNLRHLFFAWWGSVLYRHPSEKLLVIGVTGTSGKSSTIHFLRQILEAGGYRVGTLSTVDFCVAGKAKFNDQKMTMLGRMQIQKYLREMVDAGCQIAIVETTSEGAVQYRHRFINYDTILLTNLYPEHIESHGSFENYKRAKLKIFRHVAGCKKKVLPSENNEQRTMSNIMSTVPKIAIVNGESEYAQEFLAFPFDEKFRFSKHDAVPTNILGEHNAQNVAAAATAARVLGVSDEILRAVGLRLTSPPGRIEFIPEAEKYGFRVIVDYAFEPVAMAALYEVVKILKPKRIIHVFGSTGGGRDASRRFTVGKFVGERADICIVTDEDPYDDNPLNIMNDVAAAVKTTGKVQKENLLIISDRREAIQKAIDLTEPGDMVLVTGKGSEQGMVVKGKIIPWDDRGVVRQCLLLL